MRRYLVVANLTLGGQQLLEALRGKVAEGPCTFHVLVPAGTDPHGWSHDEASDVGRARERLDAALGRFRALGADVTGEVGDARPVDGILDALRTGHYDEVILSTLPAGVSKWLRLDLVHRVNRAVDVPVTHVIAQPEAVT
jgi:hypothetical protein